MGLSGTTSGLVWLGQREGSEGRRGGKGRITKELHAFTPPQDSVFSSAE